MPVRPFLADPARCTSSRRVAGAAGRPERSAAKSLRCAGVALAAFALAAAGPLDRVTVHHDAPPGAAHYARLVIKNRIGTYNQIETQGTAKGPVSVEYVTTPPSRVGDPGSADHACVVALPDGVIAVPPCIDIMEMESGEILLQEWIGG